MKLHIAIAAASLLAAHTAFARHVRPQPSKAPVQVAQARGGASSGAGQATGSSGVGHTITEVAVIAGWIAVAASAASTHSTTSH